MNPVNNKPEVLLLTTWPPRECGIATYSQDLADSLKVILGSTFTVKVCALENGDLIRNYPEEVEYVLNTKISDNYIQLAEAINQNRNIRLVFIQHEFGLYEGKYGESILYFLYSLKKPKVITFHTVLPQPSEERKAVVKSIVDSSAKVMIMTRHSFHLLVNEYGVPEHKIYMIPHGTHPVVFKDKSKLKEKSGLENRTVLSTFGLLSTNKGIETALDSLPVVIREFPNVIYLIIGKTHPEVVKKEKEKYRRSLIAKVSRLKLQNHVQFINRYVPLSELLDLLQMTDIYLFTSKDENQSVSGTFSYARSCGCPIIATAIPHAREVLTKDSGILVDFQHPEQLSDAIVKLLRDNVLRQQMGLNALNQSIGSQWRNVAIKHGKMLQSILPGQKLVISPPPITLKHLIRMTDKVGLVQFSKLYRPDIRSGYTLDDNARALIAVCMNFKYSRRRSDLLLIERYLQFIQMCQQKSGFFYNYYDKNGEIHNHNHHINLDDSNGRAMWALGVLISMKGYVPPAFILLAKTSFNLALTTMDQLHSPRALAFTIKGLHHYNIGFPFAGIAKPMRLFTERLVKAYQNASDNQWKWFEESMTYGNSVLPESVLYAYLGLKNEQYKDIAIESFDYLLSRTFIDDQIRVIPNKGWLKKSDAISLEKGGEQPIDVAYTILTLNLFYKVFGQKRYLDKMETAFSWFLGNNHLQEMIYNTQTGGCHDGLEKANVNLNQGAESTVCYLMARLVWQNVLDQERNKARRMLMEY